jgi:outer membrane protein
MSVASVAFTQTTAWSFRRCLDTALMRNISLNQSRLSNELNKVSLAQVKATRIPSLSANANEALNVGKNIDPTTNTFVTEAYHSTNFSISSGYTLFNGFQNNNNINQQRLNVQAGEYEIEKVKNDVTLNITTGYLQVLFAMEILAAAEMQEKATAAQVERTEKMVNAGKSPESDLLQIQSQIASDRLAVVNAKNQYDMARVNLMQLMDIPVDPGFAVEKPALEVEALAEPVTNQQIYEKALVVLPQVTGANLKSNASQFALKMSEGARWPRLNLGAGMNTNYASSRKKSSVNKEGYPFFEQIWDNIGQSLSMSLAIPIYSNRQIKSNIERAKINLATSQLNEQNVKSTLRKNVEQTYVDVRAALKKHDAVKQQVTSAEASYKNAEKKYQVGVMNATDYLIQKNSFDQAQSSLIQAKFDYIFKQKILDFYMGKGIDIK